MKITKLFEQSSFTRAFKALSPHYLHVIFLDFLYYLILLLTGSFYVYKILPDFLHMLDVTELLQNGAYGSAAEFFDGLEFLSAEFTSFKIWTIIIAILLVANYCLFKYLIWNKILKIKEKPKKIAKHIGLFTVLNILIIAKIIVFLIMCWYIFTIDVFNIMFFFVVPLVAIYKINILHPLFAIHKDIKKTYRAFVHVAVKNVHKFMIPYTIMALGLFLLMQYILPLFLFLPGAAYFLIYIISFAAYFSWTKYYIHEIIKTTGSKK